VVGQEVWQKVFYDPTREAALGDSHPTYRSLSSVLCSTHPTRHLGRLMMLSSLGQRPRKPESLYDEVLLLPGMMEVLHRPAR
jgi:hypothetical protein